MSEIRNRILIVDDDPQIASGLAALLSDEWDVRTAANGRQALVAFAEFSPDVVLLDVLLPDMTGIDLLHQFKMYSETTPVIMMSGGGSLERVIESMKLGAETFLQKPFDNDTLTLTLEQASRMVAQQRELLALRRAEAKDVERIVRAVLEKLAVKPCSIENVLAATVVPGTAVEQVTAVFVIMTSQELVTRAASAGMVHITAKGRERLEALHKTPQRRLQFVAE